MTKLTRRERSAINKAKFRADRGGRSSSKGWKHGELSHRHDRESEHRGSPVVPSGWIDLNNGDDPYMFRVIKGKVHAHSIGKTNIFRRIPERFQAPPELMEGRRAFVGGAPQPRVKVAIHLEGGQADRVGQSLAHSLEHKRLDAEIRDHPEQRRGQNGNAGKSVPQVES